MGVSLPVANFISLWALFVCFQFQDLSSWYKRSKQNRELGIFAFFLSLPQLIGIHFSFFWSTNWKLPKTNQIKKIFKKENKGYFIFSVISPSCVCDSSVFTHLYFLFHCIDSLWKNKQLNSSRAPFGATLFGSSYKIICDWKVRMQF